jgi:hypothetical protein
MMIVFTVAVLGALILVTMRSCTDHLDGMYQNNEGATGLPQDHPMNLDQKRLDKLKKLLQKEGMN